MSCHANMSMVVVHVLVSGTRNQVARQASMTGQDRGIPSFGCSTYSTPPEPGCCAPFALVGLFLPQNRPARPSASISLSYGPLSFQCWSSRHSSPPFDFLSFDLSRKAPHNESLLLSYCTNARFSTILPCQATSGLSMERSLILIGRTGLLSPLLSL